MCWLGPPGTTHTVAVAPWCSVVAPGAAAASARARLSTRCCPAPCAAIPAAAWQHRRSCPTRARLGPTITNTHTHTHTHTRTHAHQPLGVQAAQPWTTPRPSLQVRWEARRSQPTASTPTTFNAPSLASSSCSCVRRATPAPTSLPGVRTRATTTGQLGQLGVLATRLCLQGRCRTGLRVCARTHTHTHTCTHAHTHTPHVTPLVNPPSHLQALPWALLARTQPEQPQLPGWARTRLQQLPSTP